MAGVGLGPSLAEAYVKRGMYREKMKKQKAAETTDDIVAHADDHKKIRSACFFFSVSNKSRSTKVVSSAAGADCQCHHPNSKATCWSKYMGL